jgi:hypothetical protein
MALIVENNNASTPSETTGKIDDSFISSLLVPSQVILKSDRVTRGKKNQRKYYKKKKYATQKPKANVWVYIPEDHLRAHPLYKQLPVVESIRKLNSFSDLSLFRQSSLQWNLMHTGRLTTSRAAGATGMLEKKHARKLGIPDSLSGNGKARQSFFHLRDASVFVDLLGAEKFLCGLVESNNSDIHKNDVETKLLIKQNEEYVSTLEKSLWTKHDEKKNGKKFAYNYMRNNDKNNVNKKQNAYNKYNRMAYGNIQEPTAILVALNHFYKYNYTIHECGMYAGEALLEKYDNHINNVNTKQAKHDTKSNISTYSELQMKQIEMLKELLKIGCRIGASPDGIIKNNKNQNDVQALEVKNHLNLNKQAYATFESMSTWYVVQLQLEMFCIGPNCKSAILVRLSSTKGAVIFKMKRDDEYILMMLKRFQIFYSKFVLTKTPPPSNFDYEDALLQRFVEKTNNIAKSKTSIVKRLWPNQIQRSPYYYQS